MESSWVQHLEGFVDGRTETSFAPNEIPVNKLDVYISGLAMELTRLVSAFDNDSPGNNALIPFPRYLSIISISFGDLSDVIHTTIGNYKS